MAMTTQEKTAYRREYNKDKYDVIRTYLPKSSGKKEIWQTAAKERDMSVSELIITAVDEYLKE